MILVDRPFGESDLVVVVNARLTKCPCYIIIIIIIISPLLL